MQADSVRASIVRVFDQDSVPTIEIRFDYQIELEVESAPKDGICLWQRRSTRPAGRRDMHESGHLFSRA